MDITPDERSCITRKPRTTVNDLTPDVLLNILRDVFKEELPIYIRRGAGYSCTPIQRVPLSPLDDRVTDLSRCSAEHLASVSPPWRYAMSGASIFWQQLVIWIGADPTPLSRIREYIAWSRGHPLHIYILRRYDPSTEDHTEKAYVKAAIDMLLPHVRRWKVLYVSLLHSSSLPLPHADLVGHAENLVQLNLDFVFDDAIAHAMGATSPTGRLDMPVLEELSMGGVHFRESYVVPYPQVPLPPKLRYLTLTDYDSQNIPFSVFDFVTALITCKDLFRLHLKNLRLDISDTGTSSPRQPPWNYNFGFNLDFTDMSGDVIAELNRLLQYVLADSASYTCCSMPIRNTFPLWCVCDAFRVSFVDIASPMVLVNLLAGEASGGSYREVLISRSDGLQSEVLHALTTPTATEHGGVDWPCPHLRELHINSCKQFSSKDLRDMLEARLKAHEETEFAMEDDGADFVLRSVTELYVHDCGELAPDDKEWFDKNVERVQWDDWRGGTEWP